MKYVVAAINAKYIHTGLGARSVYAYARQWIAKPGNEALQERVVLELEEYTINQRMDTLLDALYRAGADAYCFSCYIWNIGLIQDLLPEMKKIMPESKIILGGPEVQYGAQVPQADIVVTGEGENTFCRVIAALEGDTPLQEIPGLMLRDAGGTVTMTSAAEPMEMQGLPIAYGEEELSAGKILYFESSRGCPFQCQYCLSSIGKGVRYRPLGETFSLLDQFLAAKPVQVKFVDRTFNCSKPRALKIWKYLSDHDNGVTNFHFEITAELLDEESLAFLSSARDGLFQFEIGVQSANPQTLEAVKRETDLELLRRVVNRLHQQKNIHLHLDLIAGLPYESLESFQHSFNVVYDMEPDQLQLGFLKVLHGSGLAESAERYGIVSRTKAPYEVLFTPWISYMELQFLHDVEELVETFYNSGRFRRAIRHLCLRFPTPFDGYGALAKWWREQGYFAVTQGNLQYYTRLCEFYETNWEDSTWFQWLLKADFYLHERPKKIPDGIRVEMDPNWKRQAEEILSARGMRSSRTTAGAVFPQGALTDREEWQQPVLLIIDYSRRGISGEAAYEKIPLQQDGRCCP